MKMSFLRLGVLTISLLSASVFSLKIFEIHFHLESRSEAKPATSNSSTGQTVVSETSDSPTRISFRRGNVDGKISGIVYRSRNYVLRAKDGQNLSARISSPNGCVVFNTGSPTIDYTTARGDNWLTVVNNCGGQSNFDLAVEIR